ncbi:MAG: GNAT family N-acetyltransferase [Patescibacteria group bacterium]
MSLPDILQVNIETKRLVLVPVSLAYAADAFREFTDEITWYMSPATPKHQRDIEAWMIETIEKMSRREELACVILRKDTKEFLGCAGLHDIQTKAPHLGIWIKKGAHGYKYGREAMTAMKQWADTHLEYDHLVYPVALDNIASRKIPESLGGVVVKEYTQTTQNGHTWPYVEYWVYKNGRQHQRPKILQDITPEFDWDSTKIWRLDLPTEEMGIDKLAWQFEYPFWEKEGTDDWNLTLKEFLADPTKHPTHYTKVQAADLKHPLDVVFYKGRYRVLDGLHRLAKAYLNGDKTVSVRIIPPEKFGEIQK